MSLVKLRKNSEQDSAENGHFMCTEDEGRQHAPNRAAASYSGSVPHSEPGTATPARQGLESRSAVGPTCTWIRRMRDPLRQTAPIPVRFRLPSPTKKGKKSPEATTAMYLFTVT